MPPSSFSGLLNQSIVLQRYTGGTDGDATYGTPETILCRIDAKINRVLNNRGDEITSTATIYIEVDVGDRDKLTLPDATERTPLQVLRIPGRNGQFHHAEVMI